MEVNIRLQLLRYFSVSFFSLMFLSNIKNEVRKIWICLRRNRGHSLLLRAQLQLVDLFTNTSGRKLKSEQKIPDLEFKTGMTLIAITTKCPLEILRNIDKNINPCENAN